MPTSVLLAVLAAAGLLALAPALVRRYDATERLVAERAISTARVLSRQRRRRTVPGRRPINPSRTLTEASAGTGASVAAGPAPGRPSLRLVGESDRPILQRPRHRPAVYRRRRVLAGLILLNLVELAGVPLVGPGFWISVAVTASLLVLYLGHLRGQALRQHRRRRAEARQAAWLAEQQAQVRVAQRRRAQARREAARQLQEELLRTQEALRELQARAATAPEPEELPKVATISYRPARATVRGRPYHAGPAA